MPPIRKNGCGKQLPQPKTHTSPADRQAMTTHRAERYTNFPRKAQRTGRPSPPDTMSCRSSAGNQVHPLNSSLIFSLSYHTRRKKATSAAVFVPRNLKLREIFRFFAAQPEVDGHFFRHLVCCDQKGGNAMRRVIPFAPWQTAYFLRWLRDMSDRGWVLQTIKGVKAVFVPAAPGGQIYALFPEGAAPQEWTSCSAVWRRAASRRPRRWTVPCPAA